MPVVIRMKRTGRRNRPCYRITVIDGRQPRDGRTIENLGLYDPIASDQAAQVKIDVERARYWVSVGAKPSETVRSIFKRQGVFEGRAPAKPRRRPKRKLVTATSARRERLKTERTERKKARHGERVATRRAAAKSASSDATA